MYQDARIHEGQVHIETVKAYPYASDLAIALTLRLLMSHIYVYTYMEHPFLMFLDHIHNDAAQSVGLLWTSDQLVAETST